ncbi:MAG TPA: hypothetical protein PKC08_12155 [Pseudomonadales bacterium]|nr:hypothetical protein [Pseudomonadales bacterium]
MLAVRAIRIIGWLLASLLLASTWRVCAAETSLERQRILYRDSLAALRSGNRQPLLRARPDLLDYPLYPYLELEDLRRRNPFVPADVDRADDAFVTRRDESEQRETQAQRQESGDHRAAFYPARAGSSKRSLSPKK